MRKLKLLLMSGLILLTQQLWAQTKTVTGTVSDANGSGIPNATIKVKGSKSGTSADASGNFSISASSGSTLVISAVGYDEKDVKVGAESAIAVQLNQDQRSLSEVVVTGTGTATSKKKLAISVETITSDKLPATPAGSIDQALVGKIAGAQINTTSGNPGSPVSIQLRGINTIQSGSQPMILIDGVQMGSSALSTLDLNAIDRVEVVQGAAAATIYGAQGANGVIQVFTKRGKSGTAKIDFSTRVSWDDYINKGDVHQPKLHSFKVDANGDITQGGSTTTLLTQNTLGLWGNPVWLSGATDQNNKPYKNNTTYYDHFAEQFRKAMTKNYNLYVSGGKDKSDYAIGLSRVTQESIIDGQLERTNLTANFGFEVFKNFKIRAINQLVYTTNSTGNQNISSAMYTYPFASLKYVDADGNPTYKFGGAGANNSNPYYFRKYRKFDDRQTDIIPTLNVSYKFPKFVDLDYKYGINVNRDDYTRTDANQEDNKSSAANNYFVGAGIKGTIRNFISRTTNQNSLLTANLKFDLDKDFGLKIPLVSTTTAAYDWRKRYLTFTDLQYTGLPKYPANANQAETKSILQVYDETFITYGYFVNQRFDWADIGGVSAGFRSDYSSTFGDLKKPQTFPRGDAYFRLSSLKFWDAISGFAPEFKLRAAYGEAGIQPGTFDRIVTLSSQTADNGPLFYNPALVANPLLTVERSKETEVGADISLKPGKKNWLSNVAVSATYWKRTGTDIIWTVPLPISSGASEIKSNVLGLSSKGFQFSVDATMFHNKAINWNLLTVFGTSQTKTDYIVGTPDIPLVWGSAATYTLRPGERFGTIYGYKALTSVDQVDPDGNPYIAAADKGKYEIVEGRVVEKASKRVQFTPDKYVLGNTNPKFNMSFTNTISYKDYLNLSFQFDWIAGAKQYNQTKEWMYSEGLHGDFDKPVTIDGQTGNWTAYYRSFYDAVESNGTKDFFLENSSFVRLRNLSLAVDMAKLFKIPFTNRLQLTVSGRNLLTFTKYTGLDPEANQNTTGSGSTGTTQSTVQKGLDFWSFPNTKSFQVGINIGLN
jgi:TonB-dependent starch-binding outer membrane protein SusC